MPRKQRINASRKPGESLKAAARRLMGNGQSGEIERDAEHWFIGKHVALGRTHGDAVMRVLRFEADL